jgi:hypothetical protein
LTVGTGPVVIYSPDFTVLVQVKECAIFKHKVSKHVLF